MPVDDEQILPAVVVVIKEPIGETNKRNRRHRNPRAITDIRKESRAIVLEKHVVIVSKRRA